MLLKNMDDIYEFHSLKIHVQKCTSKLSFQDINNLILY